MPARIEMNMSNSPSHTPDKNITAQPNVNELGMGKGRIMSFDPRDQNFRMRTALATIEPTVNRRFWKTGPVLNQGTTQQCVAYAGQQFLMSYPVVNKPYKTEAELYHLCQLNDEWQGTEPAYFGTSTRALMKVLRAAGLIQSYLWAFNADTVRRWLLMRGPVIIGTSWYTGMNNTDASGFIYPTGNPEGGHETMLRGWDDTVRCPRCRRLGAARLLNSWSEDWGQQGKAWVCSKDLDGLIKNHGEAVTVYEIENASPVDVTGVIP